MKKAVLILLGLSFVFPLFSRNQYYIYLSTVASIFIIQAVGLNLVLGYCGLLSFAHTACFAIGGYASGLLAIHWGLPTLLTLFLGAGFTALIGFGIGYLTLRLRGPYFVVVTFGFHQITYLVALNWISLTQGPMALTGIPRLKLSIPFLLEGKNLSSIGYYYFGLILVVILVFIIHRLINSQVGRALKAIRQHEFLSESVGISRYKYFLLAFVISTFMSGVAGGFYAHFMGIMSPEAFALSEVIIVILMVVVGGQGTLAGPILGGLIFTYLPEFLRVVKMYRMVIYGGILLLSVLFFREGVAYYLEKLIVRIKSKGLHKEEKVKI